MFHLSYPFSPFFVNMPKNHIRILVLDTETTGKLPPHKYGQPFPPSDAYPYITQLSWMMYNAETKTVETSDDYIQVPVSIPISEEITRITGITRALLTERGKPIVDVLMALYRAYIRADFVVAHNIHFDAQVIRQEIYRNRESLYQKTGSYEIVRQMRALFTKEFDRLNEIEQVCTMKSSIQLCAIPFPESRLSILATVALQDANMEVPPPKKPPGKKFPTLAELYMTLFPEDTLPIHMHNAITDVAVCLRCFLKLREYPDLPLESMIPPNKR